MTRPRDLDPHTLDLFAPRAPRVAPTLWRLELQGQDDAGRWYHGTTIVDAPDATRAVFAAVGSRAAKLATQDATAWEQGAPADVQLVGLRAARSPTGRPGNPSRVRR